jgi:hypothetical protein
MDAYQFESRFKARIKECGRDEPPQELFDRIRALIEREATGSQDG